MKKIIQTIAIIFFVLSHTHIQAQNCACTLTGTLPSRYSGKVYLSKVEKVHGDIMPVIVDSSIAVNGEFQICLKKLEKTDIYQLYTKNMFYSTQLALSPHTEMEVNIQDNENAEITVVKGGEEQKAMNDLRTVLKTVTNKLLAASGEDKDGKPMLKITEKAYDSLFTVLNKEITEAIKKYPNNLASFWALQETIVLDGKPYMDVYECLDTTSYHYSYYFDVAKGKYLKAKEKWLVGNNAENFTATDLRGKLYKLSDFKGKYVLIDFWASWCKPCRVKNKHVAEVADKLKEKKIEIISFSFDNVKAAWEGASKADKISWINLSDLKGFKKSPLIKKYKIEQLPAVFLINPDGKIIEQGIALDKLLEMELK